MIRLLKKKIYFVSFLLINICLISSVYAATNQVVQGNIIKKISVSSQDGTPILLIKGVLSPNQLKGIIIKQQRGSKDFSIVIPNALIDPESITKTRLRFGSRTPISAIQISEGINLKGDDAQFTVTLNVKAKKNFGVEVLKPIKKTALKIKLIDLQEIEQEKMEAERKKAEAEVVVETEKIREQAKDRQFEIELEKKRVADMRKKATFEIVQDYHRPSIMQLSIVNASGWQKRAYKLSVFLGKEKKMYIEENMGIKLDIVNISNAKNDIHQRSTIYFRNNFLKSALFLAGLIPGEQRLVPISMKRERIGVDIEIYLGRDYK